MVILDIKLIYHRLSVCLSVYQTNRLSIYPSIIVSLSVYLSSSACLSVYLWLLLLYLFNVLFF